jgi:hypothetical protein
MKDMKIFYNSLSISTNYQKWYPTVEECLGMKLKFKRIIDELSIFCDKYTTVVNNMNMIYSPWIPVTGIKKGIVYPTSNILITQQYQQNMECQYTTTEALELIRSDIYEYIFSILVNSNIKSKYYNIFTGHEGIALENGLFIENEKILNNKIEDEINNNLLKIIHKRIDFILNPEIRKAFLREKKLKRILK